MATFISLGYKSCHFVDKGILKVFVLKFLVTNMFRVIDRICVYVKFNAIEFLLNEKHDINLSS